MSELLRAIKRPYSYRVRKLLEENGSPLLERLTIRQRPGVKTFRFWQEGPGYDRNLTHAESVKASIQYVHMNPVRRGLCEKAANWNWSSARWHEKEGTSRDASLPKLASLPAEWWDAEGVSSD
jgi:putative transposase